MNAVPKTYFDGDIKWMPGADENRNQVGLWIECETTHPKSAQGKTVWVYFAPEMVTKALLLFKDAAIRERAETLKS